MSRLTMDLTGSTGPVEYVEILDDSSEEDQSGQPSELVGNNPTPPLWMADVVAYARRGMKATPVRLFDVMTTPVWQDDDRMAAFRAEPTYDVPVDPPEGSEVWRGVKTIQPGGIRIYLADGPPKTILLTGEQRYRLVSELYANGWDPHSGLVLPRVDVELLHGKPLYEVLSHAVGNGVSSITQLEFEHLYPEKAFVAANQVPHVVITYDVIDQQQDPQAKVYFGVGEWLPDDEDGVFQGCDLPQAKAQAIAIFDSLGGLVDPDDPDVAYTVCGLFSKALQDDVYRAQLLLYELPPQMTVDGMVPGGFARVSPGHLNADE